jgi:hypothetical protein
MIWWFVRIALLGNAPACDWPLDAAAPQCNTLQGFWFALFIPAPEHGPGSERAPAG